MTAGDPDRGVTASAEGKLVILVHGIRTWAPWYVDVRDELSQAGFAVELTNYGRFDLFRFLLPIPWFRRRAAEHVIRDIRDAKQQHPGAPISVVAHSFGTYIIAHILENEFDIEFDRIIFCGSIVRFDFPFQNFRTRFKPPLVNEVGTRDIWPILAESVTWGYGSAGAFGFNRPGIFDRYHGAVTHSAFLNAEFCRTWWVPVLKGESPKPHDRPESPPWWLRIWSILPIKYSIAVILLLIFGFYALRAPEREVRIQREIAFVGQDVARLHNEAAEPCPWWWWPEWLWGRRCMRTTGIESAAESIVVCLNEPYYLSYRDPIHALENLAEGPVMCLDVRDVGRQELRISLNKQSEEGVTSVHTDNGEHFWACGCDQGGIDRLQQLRER